MSLSSTWEWMPVEPLFKLALEKYSDGKGDPRTLELLR